MDERELYEREESIGLGERALRRLRAEHAAGDTSPGGLLLYRGRAGLGKTSLLNRLRALANENPEGQRLLYARAGERARGNAFHVARGLLHPILAEMTEPERAELFGDWAGIAAPALGLVPPDREKPADPSGVQEALSWVVTQLSVRSGPILLVVDDLHWADPESLDWLAGYLGQISPLPLLAVLAYRNDELPEQAEAALLHEVGELDTRGRLVELNRLGPASVATMVRSRLGDDADDLFCRTCWSTTDGNPLQVSSLIERLVEQKIEPLDENGELLREVVAQSSGEEIGRRLERFGTDVQRTAFAAAVLDTPFDVDLISRVAGLPPNQAQTAIDKLVADQLLVRQAGPGRRFAFTHPTVGSAVYQSIKFPAMRTSIHTKAADEILSSGDGGMAAASRHLIQIHPEDNPVVVEQLRQAAHEHLAMGAPDAARRCLERALHEPPADGDIPDIRYELAEAAQLIDPACTANQLQLALAEVPGLDPVRRETATMRLGQALTHTNRVQEAVELTAAEVARLPDGPGKTRLQTGSFMWRALRRNDPEGLESSRELEQLAAQHRMGQDPESRAVQVVRAWDLTMRGESSVEALALADRGLEDGRPAEGLGWTNKTWGFEIPVMLGVSYIYNDRLDRARDLFADASREFELAGWTGGHLGFAVYLQALVLHRMGKLADAEKYLVPTLRKADRLGPGGPLHWDVVALLCETYLCQGRVQEAVELAEKYEFGANGAYPPAAVLPDAPVLHGRLLLAQGKFPEAVEELRKAGAELDRRGWKNTVWSPWLGHLALAVHPTDPEQARGLAGEALRRAQHAGINSAEGLALRYCAQVAEPGQELGLLKASVGALGQSPAAFEHATSLVDYGAALRRDGRPREAVQNLEQGLEIARSCGAGGLADRARRELRAAGVSPHQLRPLPSHDLTAQQLRAARLAARFTAEGLDPGALAGAVGEAMSVSKHRAAELMAAVYRTLGTSPQGLAESLREDPGLGWEDAE